MSTTPREFQIRQGVAADEAAVVDLWNRVLAYPEPHNEPVGRFRRKMAYDDGLLFVADVGGDVVGTAVGGYDGVRGWIYAVAVDPGHRRAGVATALLATVEAELVRRGCPKINVYVRPENLGMADFYARFGYGAEAGIALSKVTLEAASGDRE